MRGAEKNHQHEMQRRSVQERRKSSIAMRTFMQQRKEDSTENVLEFPSLPNSRRGSVLSNSLQSGISLRGGQVTSNSIGEVNSFNSLGAVNTPACVLAELDEVLRASNISADRKRSISCGTPLGRLSPGSRPSTCSPTLPCLKPQTPLSQPAYAGFAMFLPGEKVWAPAKLRKKMSSRKVYRWSQGKIQTHTTDGIHYDVAFDQSLKYHNGKHIHQNLIVPANEEDKENNLLKSSAGRVAVATKYSLISSEQSTEYDRPTLARIYNAFEGHKWESQGNWLTNRPLCLWDGINDDYEMLDGQVYSLDISSKVCSVQLFFPIAVCQLRKLERLNLEHNQLTGEIPLDIGELPNLIELKLAHNDLTGNIPPSLAQVMPLVLIDVSLNSKMGGVIHQSLMEKIGLCIKKRGTGLQGKEAWSAVPLYPLFVVPVSKLLQLTRLVAHEQAGVIQTPNPDLTPAHRPLSSRVRSARSRFPSGEGLADVNEQTLNNGANESGGLLLQLYTNKVLQAWNSNFGLVSRDELCFISHRWMRPDEPDPHPDDETNTKLEHLKQIALAFPNIKYFFIDYMSIPQDPKNKAYKQLAIDSMFYYVKCCGSFIVAIMGEENEETSKNVYLQRGWCRFERLIALCPLTQISVWSAAGLTSLEIAVMAVHKATSEIQAEQEELGSVLAGKIVVNYWTQHLGDTHLLNPMKGKFTNDADKFRLAQSLKTLCVNFLMKTPGEFGFAEIGEQILFSSELTSSIGLHNSEADDLLSSDEIVSSYVNEMVENTHAASSACMIS